MKGREKTRREERRSGEEIGREGRGEDLEEINSL